SIAPPDETHWPLPDADTRARRRRARGALWLEAAARRRSHRARSMLRRRVARGRSGRCAHDGRRRATGDHTRTPRAPLAIASRQAIHDRSPTMRRTLVVTITAGALTLVGACAAPDAGTTDDELGPAPTMKDSAMRVRQTNLVSDQMRVATHMAPALINAWGLA